MRQFLTIASNAFMELVRQPVQFFVQGRAPQAQYGVAQGGAAGNEIGGAGLVHSRDSG